MRSDEPVLAFPCEIDVKAMGRPEDGFRDLVTSLVAANNVNMARATVSENPSRGGKYVSVTVRFEAESRAQLDAVYQSLSDEPRVLVAL
ncbi:MAG: DUF493 domain-containing protein [Pseudomonadota bacterium]